MLPLFLPEGTSFDKLLRALIGVALFSAAYMAEVVRGGLQAIPKGQYEGAMALGLSYWQMMSKIVLPQALKISIPEHRRQLHQPVQGHDAGLDHRHLRLARHRARGHSRTRTGRLPVQRRPAISPLALMFWIFCFGMSRYSMYTERRLNTGHKR